MRVIMEAILEAHQNVDNYGGTWYVLNDRFMSVVKESYFITEDGTRKNKAFVSLYNTDDMFYGNDGIGHLMTYKDGKVEVVGTDIETQINDHYDNFKQPYGDKPEKQVTYEQVGTVGFGKTHAVEQSVKNMVIRKSRAIGNSSTMIDPPIDKFKVNADKLPMEYIKLYNTMGDINSETYYPSEKSPIPTDSDREKLRKKRKKKGKKTHRKKKK